MQKTNEQDEFFVLKSIHCNRYLLKSKELEDLHDYNNSEYSIPAYSSSSLLECFCFIIRQHPQNRTSYCIETEL